jgi:hypothetical protein
VAVVANRVGRPWEREMWSSESHSTARTLHRDASRERNLPSSPVFGALPMLAGSLSMSSIRITVGPGRAKCSKEANWRSAVSSSMYLM